MKTYTNAIDGTTTAPILKVDASPTNYRPDTHKKFCERCFSRNRVCPSTGGKRKSEFCRV